MKLNTIPVILLSLFLMGGCNYFKNHRLFSKDVDSVLDMTIKEPEPVAEDTAQYYAEESYVEPEIDPEPVYTPSDDRYFMIVGSFQNQNLARSYAEKIQQLGYNTQIIEASNGFYRVSAKSYDNFRQGVSEISDFRQSLSAGAWLHVRN